MFINFRDVMYTDKFGGTITRKNLFDLINNDMIVDDVSNGVLHRFVVNLYVCTDIISNNYYIYFIINQFKLY